MVDGRLRDMSRSGAAVETKEVAAIGDPIVLGSTRGRVSRSFQGGFAVQFSRLLPLERFGAAFRL